MTSPSESDHRSVYFVNPWVDCAMIGGASIVVYGLLSLLRGGERIHDTTALLATQLSWICNWPHFSATNYRLYPSKRNILQYPVTSLAVPILILAAIAS